MTPRLRVEPKMPASSLGRSVWLNTRPMIARHRRNPLIRAVSNLCRVWLKAYENCNSDFETNGEEMILQRLATAGLQTVFDVGSNYGQWALMAHHYIPEAAIHSFELSPPTYQHLLTNVGDCPAIRTYNFGLADSTATIEFYHYADKPGETSLLKHPFQGGAQKLQGHVQRGDQFCRAQGIDHIDLLKIDVEGMESAVLAGLKDMLAAKKIDLIQFEYEKLNTLTKFLLGDFHALLEGHGFALGKVYPNYIDFRGYDFFQELDWGSNYLAVRKDRPDLQQLFPH